MEVSEKLDSGMDLTFEETTTIFEAMLDRKLAEDDMERVLTRLADKGETGEEIAAAARALRSRAIAVDGHAGGKRIFGCSLDGAGDGCAAQ